MLLFIKTPYRSSGKTYTRFNTSHVVIYLISVKLSVPFFPCFNTSHVVIYHSCQVCNPHERNVSIHLMLLFICFILRNCIKIDTFQYISCCYLSLPAVAILLVYYRFNTSHVVIYPKGFHKGSSAISFQYISCCYLSLPYLIIYLYHTCFNTSHVVIYPELTLAKMRGDEVFQYTSCCYLSGGVLQGGGEAGKFQYISCCYLSRRVRMTVRLQNSFNTSHVVIYQEARILSMRCGKSFNTSHVVIYHSCSEVVNTCKNGFNTSHVVIYLVSNLISFSLKKFQYISCCYLSRTLLNSV